MCFCSVDCVLHRAVSLCGADRVIYPWSHVARRLARYPVLYSARLGTTEETESKYFVFISKLNLNVFIFLTPCYVYF